MSVFTVNRPENDVRIQIVNIRTEWIYLRRHIPFPIAQIHNDHLPTTNNNTTIQQKPDTASSTI